MDGNKLTLEERIKYEFTIYFGKGRDVNVWYNRVHPHFGHSPAELVEMGKGEEFLEYINHATGKGGR